MASTENLEAEAEDLSYRNESSGGSSIISVIETPPLNTETSWKSFKYALFRYRTFILFTTLAAACFITGIGVYYGTTRQDWINIHLIPHSHDDVGWLLTPDTYYEHSVKYILNNVIHELQKDRNRKFTYVETYFFWRWWIQQSAETQSLTIELVRNQQLQFAGGAWTMNDEATTNYQSIIDQFSWGLRKLNETFGELARPTVGWQIDTFGHSREMTSLLVHMGYKGLFFARVDEDERKQRRNQRAMEFIWSDRDGATNLLTSIMYKHYNPPSGYHYEKEINEGANLDGFLEAVREWATAYGTTNVLVPMGDDFTYYDARAWFDNMDTLIRLVDERKDSLNVNMFYSTPEQYLKAIQKSSHVWPIKGTSDFFPYASDMFSYWTGYFTSRPSLKIFERYSNNILQAVKQVVAMVGNDAMAEESLNDLREAMGVVMHHDAITGTSKQHVNDHYLLLLHNAVMKTYSVIIDTLGKLSFRHNKAKPRLLEPCLRLNESVCHVSEASKSFVMTAYNTLSWPANHIIRLPVSSDSYSVRNSQGVLLESQIVLIQEEILRLPGRSSSAIKELVFLTGNIPPLSFISFHISLDFQPPITSQLKPVSSKVLFNFHKYTGRLTGVIRDNHTYPLHQDIEYYYGAPFWTGAYIFRPSNPYTYPVGPQSTNILAADGAVVMETQQNLGPWASQAIRAYSGFPLLEFEWLVGPIPTEDYHGKEVVIRYSSNINSSGVFYTDTNGRGTLKRRRDKRDDWVYTVHEVVSGNYYPVTSHISLRDNNKSQMTVLTDRAQGGSSLWDGQIELMVHRRLCYDDSKGVNEPLNETAYGKGLVARGKHWVLLSEPGADTDVTVRRLGLQLQHPPLLLFAPTEFDYLQWQGTYLTEFTGLRERLPDNVRILTLEPWRDNLILLRLEHLFEATSPPPLSHRASVKLQNLFNSFEIVAVRETLLGADRWLVEGTAEWRTGDMTITLQPASIRTFLAHIFYRQSYK